MVNVAAGSAQGEQQAATKEADKAPASGDSPEIETELSRDLGLVSVLAIGIGTMIAAGIFTLSGLAVGRVGSAAVVSFLAAAVVATFTALTYCEFSSIYPYSGEGYLYARRTFNPPLAYMVGWCLLLGYTASCAFYITSLSAYFNDFVWASPAQIAPGLVALFALTLLNMKGTKESGNFQIVVTFAKVGLLIWFVTGGLGHLNADVIIDHFNRDLSDIASTSALVFITFFGFSAIAASAGEVHEPTKTIPRAIFISVAVVTVLYALVVLVMVVSDLPSYDEAAMGTVAKKFLGSAGGMVIVGGALFSMVSASNASILAGSRVALSMSQRRHLPKVVGTINTRTRTPVYALIIVGATIAAFASFLPLEDLAHFADCVLLVALILVNAALIQHRRKYPHLKRPFKVPLVPLLPALGIGANVYLLTQIDNLAPVLMAVGAMVLGFVGFMLWKGAQLEEVALPGEASQVVLERADGVADRYRVLVPIANPATVGPLVEVASDLAAQQEGAILALRVVVEPEQLPPRQVEAYVKREGEILDLARNVAIERGASITSLVRIGRNAARAILETSRERRCNLLILGWKGRTSTTRRIMGEVTDDVVNHARTDIMLLKLVGELPKRLLLPTAGGAHARRAELYAARLASARGGRLTICTVLSHEELEEREESEMERLAKTRARILESTDVDVDTKVIRHHSVSGGILEESKNHDGIVIGASGKSFSTAILFGSIPEEIANRSSKSVIVVKGHHSVKALFGRVMSELK